MYADDIWLNERSKLLMWGVIGAAGVGFLAAFTMPAATALGETAGLGELQAASTMVGYDWIFYLSFAGLVASVIAACAFGRRQSGVQGAAITVGALIGLILPFVAYQVLAEFFISMGAGLWVYALSCVAVAVLPWVVRPYEASNRPSPSPSPTLRFLETSPPVTTLAAPFEIKVSPESGLPGTRVTVKLTGCTPWSAVTVEWHRARGSWEQIWSDTVTSGAVSFTYTVPENDPPGTRTVAARSGNRRTTALFDVQGAKVSLPEVTAAVLPAMRSADL